MRSLAIFCLFAASVIAAPQAAQQPTTPPPSAAPLTLEIHGTVLEAGTNRPLEDVDVSLVPGNGILTPGEQITKVTTDGQGSFHFTPTKVGQYAVRSQKAGYTRVSSRGVSDQGNVTLTAEKPTAEFHFTLQRSGEITGRVIDDATEAPLANFQVTIATYIATNGRVSARGGTATTNAEGIFRSQTTAGDYLISSQPQVTLLKNVVTQFTPDDIKATDLDYRRIFFPGGPDVDSALPVKVPSGASADVGTLRVRKQPLYRVFVNLDPSSCPSGEQLTVIQTLVRFQSGESYPVPPMACGPFLLTHMEPGTYELLLSAGKTPDTRIASVVRYTVGEQSLELKMALSRGTLLPGTIVAAEGAGEVPLTNLKVSFGPITPVPVAEVQPHAVDAKGHFEFPNVQFGRRRVQVADLGAEFFVKEVRYQGSPVPGGLFYFSGTGQLEIEIGRSPATLTGSAMNRDKPAPGADVVFLRWPAIPEDDRDTIRHIAADKEGKFQITGIGPGEYRMFAVLATDREKAEQPAAWQRLLRRAEKLKLERGSSQNLTLLTSDPER